MLKACDMNNNDQVPMKTSFRLVSLSFVRSGLCGYLDVEEGLVRFCQNDRWTPKELHSVNAEEKTI
jgi:hypothetical protein